MPAVDARATAIAGGSLIILAGPSPPGSVTAIVVIPPSSRGRCTTTYLPLHDRCPMSPAMPSRHDCCFRPILPSPSPTESASCRCRARHRRQRCRSASSAWIGMGQDVRRAATRRWSGADPPPAAVLRRVAGSIVHHVTPRGCHPSAPAGRRGTGRAA